MQQSMAILEPLLRWLHVGAGIVWIGHLYFFNWVNAHFAATLDADTKKKVIPELMPRALYWFRWGAAWTWVTGVLLLGLVFYSGRIVFELGSGWIPAGLPAVLVVLVAPFVYDALMKRLGAKNPKAAVAVGFVLLALYVWVMATVAHFTYRAYVIHLGAMLGTIMAFNVWYRIWPAQQKIIAAVKSGQPPDAALVGLAGMRSRQNTYLSLGLLWTMLDAHTTGFNVGRWGWAVLLIVVLVAWWIGTMLFKRASKVKGF